MLFNSIFVSSFLLASTVLARPRYYHDREEPHSQLFPRVEQDHDVASNRVQKTTLWAGAVLTENAGTFVSVSGKFKVHHPSGTNGSSATAWVGIDGYGTQSVLHAGVAFLPDGKGGASYQAWYEWYPDDVYSFPGISISTGDDIRLFVTAYSANTGVVMIENITKNQSSIQHVSSSHALCRQDAEWIVEYYRDGALADFGTVTFMDAEATSATRTYNPTSGPDSATIVDIERDNRTLTSVSIHDSRLTIKYL